MLNHQPAISDTKHFFFFWRTCFSNLLPALTDYMGTFTLQRTSLDSNSVRVHIKILLGFSGGLHKKKYLGYLHALVNACANNAFLSKNRCISSQILLKVTLENRKLSFLSLFISASDKKWSHHWLLIVLHTKTRRISLESFLSEFKVSWFFPDSCLPVFVSNPKNFYTGFATSV